MDIEVKQHVGKKEQADLPYTKEDRLRFLSAAVRKLPDDIRLTAAGRERPNLIRNLELLIIKLQGCAGPAGIFPRACRLAAMCGTSAAWVRRHLKILERLHWISVERNQWETGGQRANNYQIHWMTIRSAAMKQKQKSLFDSEQKPRLQDDKAPSQLDSAPCQDDSAPSQDDSAIYKEVGKYSEKQINPDPPPNAAELDFADYVTTDAGGDWLVVVQRLMSLDVVAARECCEAAFKLGATPEHLLQIVEHYRTHKGAWGPGALKDRIAKASGAENPGALWPPAKTEYQQEQDRKAKRAKQAKAAAERKAEQEQQAKERHAASQRDADAEAWRETYREKINSLTDEQILELADELDRRYSSGFYGRKIRKTAPADRRARCFFLLSDALRYREQSAEARQEREADASGPPPPTEENELMRQRESRYGPTLDGLSEQELRAVVDRMPSFEKSWVLKQKPENWPRHCRLYFFQQLEREENDAG